MLDTTISVLRDAGRSCGVSTDADIATLRRRVEHEGQTFLTITLPSFAKVFDQAIDRGEIKQEDFPGWKFQHGVPLFMSGFFKLLFNEEGLALLDGHQMQVVAVKCIRQVTMLHGKTLLPCSEQASLAALSSYRQIEDQLASSPLSNLASTLGFDFSNSCYTLFSDIFSSIQKKVVKGELLPHHGPGATADSRHGNDKWSNRVWTERMEEAGLLASDYLFSSYRHYLNALDDGELNWLAPENECPVRVTLVPKTQKAPRVIAIEPSYIMFMQQSLMDQFVEHVTQHSLLSHFIGFNDQEPNRVMAREGSLTGGLATLDLSDASDRVHKNLIMQMFRRFPELRQAVFACRSTHAQIDSDAIELVKFASMGSALTFPLEAITFFVIVAEGIAQSQGQTLSLKFLKRLKGKVRVYGDDIIVPTTHANDVIANLTRYGLRVNAAKSFTGKHFRESCGGDYFLGQDVTPVRNRRELPRSRRHVPELVSAVSLRNNLEAKLCGWDETIDMLDKLISSIIPFPYGLPTSPALVRVDSLMGQYDCERVDPDLQRPLARAARVRAQSPKSKLSGCDALMKAFLVGGLDDPTMKDHLERAGRPRSVTVKVGWNSTI